MTIVFKLCRAAALHELSLTTLYLKKPHIIALSGGRKDKQSLCFRTMS